MADKSMRRFLAIWFGELLSALGTGMTAFALGVYAFELTGTASGTARVVLVSFLPSFLFRPLGGILADRLDRRRQMAWSSTGSAFGIGLIMLMTIRGEGLLWLVYPGAALSSFFTAFHNPAYKAAVTDLVSADQYARAGGLVQLAGAAPLLLSPFLAGISMALFSLTMVLCIDCLTFIAAAALCFATGKFNGSRVLRSKKDLCKDLFEGCQTMKETRGILPLSILVALVLFYVGLLQILLAPLVLSFADKTTLGFIQSLCAVGVLAGSLLISIRGESKNYPLMLSLTLGVMGLFFSFIGFRPHILLVLIPGFLFFLTLPFANTSIEILIRRNIPNDRQGRTWALISFITYGGALIAYGAGGFLSDRIFGPLLLSEGPLAPSLGLLFGTGPGRGIALLFCLSGVSLVLLALLSTRLKSIKELS